MSFTVSFEVQLSDAAFFLVEAKEGGVLSVKNEGRNASFGIAFPFKGHMPVFLQAFSMFFGKGAYECWIHYGMEVATIWSISRVTGHVLMHAVAPVTLKWLK